MWLRSLFLTVSEAEILFNPKQEICSMLLLYIPWYFQVQLTVY